MAWDLETAYSRMGTTPTPALDIQYQSSMDTALDVIETYLDRKLLYAVDQDEILRSHTFGYGVKRYPIEEINSVVSENNGPQLTDIDFNTNTGVVIFNNGWHGQHVQINYSGGYQAIPAGLEFAVWAVFDTIEALNSAGGGGLAAGEVESVTVPDVGTVRFSKGDTATTSGGVGFGGLIPDEVIPLLSNYSRLSA